MSALAAIDLGSNAIRLLVAEVGNSQELRVLHNSREAIRLGQDVFSGGLLTKAVISRTAEACMRFQQILKRLQVQQVRAVGTSALREAHNRDELLSAVQRASGIIVEVISGSEEARLVQRALAAEFELKKRLALLIDIGGGSVEVSVSSDGDIIFADSLRLGTVRMLQLLESQRKGEKLFRALLHEYREGVHQQLARVLRGRSLSLCIGSGGNIEALWGLRNLLVGGTSKRSFSLKELRVLTRQIAKRDVEQRMRDFSLRPDRADVIHPAALVLQSLASFSRVKRIEVARSGLKEGVVLELAVQGRQQRLPATKRIELRAKQVRAFALELGRQQAFDEQHGKRVARFAVQLFEATQRLHRLSPTERLLLEVAALLHDIGHSINYQGHHKHTYYLIKCCPFMGLNRREQLMIASIARYHRKSMPRPEHEAWADLSQQERRLVEKLAALLRIAAALDQEYSPNIRRLTLSLKPSKLRLSMQGKGSFELERWRVQQKSEMFERVFKRKVVVV